MQSSFWSCFLKNLVLLCLLLPYFHKGFILWQILQAYITVGRKRNFSECLSFYPSPHSGSHFSLKMLKHFLLFGFTLVLSASWFALAKSHLLERTMRVKELLCETVTSLWDNLGEFHRNLKAVCPIGLIKIPLWRNSIAVLLSHTVNVRNKRWVELRSKLGDGPKAKTLSLMVMIQRFVWKMFFRYLPRREYKCIWHVSWNSSRAACPAPTVFASVGDTQHTLHGQRPHAHPVLQKAAWSRLSFQTSPWH